MAATCTKFFATGRGHQGQVTGIILGEYIEGILREREGKFSFDPSYLLDWASWGAKFFPQSAFEGACLSKILSPSIERETKGDC